MALKPCPECKAQISATADTCPRCGYSFKKRNRDRAQVGCLFVVGFIALLGAISIGLKDTEPIGENSQPTQGGTASPDHAENQNHVGPPRPIAKREPENISGMPGTAKVCIDDTEIKFDTFKELTLPATTVFRESGGLSGNKKDPTTWRSGTLESRAAIVTLDPIVFTKTHPCSEAKVKMFVGPLYKELRASASDNHVFEIDDVLDYPVPAKKPTIEIGKLIDDISVRAVLLTDVTDSLTADAPLDDETKAAKCLEGAQALAAHVYGVAGRQTSMVVFIGNVPATDATYGCPFGQEYSRLFRRVGTSSKTSHRHG
jgi:Uncharacterised protein family UPF0547